ncbi:MAG: L-aspartate oxidase [Verrucomicrobiales bacterium]|jgi:L-aspartate oxidase
MRKYDYLVIGSGIAGLSFALKAARHGTVAVLTKQKGEDSNTSWAQGGICCVQAPEDSFDSHIADTLDAGAGLCDEEAVRTIVEAAPESIAELVKHGVDFDKEPDGDFSLGKEGGHSHRRILHAKDTTGKEIADSLLAAARAHEKIDLLEDHFAVDLITTAKVGMATGEDCCIGLYALDQASGEIITFRSDRVVLCTGGSGRVYLYTTNPEGATGDGVAMAWRAGAAISDMEFSQFHPTCLYHHERKSFLISEAVRGEGGVLIGQDGKEFMQNYDRRKSLAPRDIVARAIDREIKRTGGPCVYVDISHKPDGFMAERFPHISSTCLEVGIDPSKDPIPVVPAAHYQCGGVKTDMNGRTSISGLYAIGEVACTGLHGANRLASNSLLEGAVLADRAYADLLENHPVDGAPAQEFEISEWVSGDAEDVDELVVIYHNWDEIRRLMWDYVGIVRTDKRLKRAATRLRNLKREVEEFYWNFKIGSDLLELRNLVDTAALIVDSASTRHESRGLHYTLDHLDLDESQPPRHSILRRG